MAPRRGRSLDVLPFNERVAPMGIETKLKFVRAPTPRELAALRARATAKAAKDAQRLADAAAKAVADAEAKAKANAVAEAEAQDTQHPPVLFGQGQRFRT